MDTPLDIIDTLTPARLAAALGVSVKTVREARYSDALPASWYAEAERLARQKLPRSAFAFKPRRDA